MANYLAKNSRYWIEVKLPFPSTLIRRQYQTQGIQNIRNANPGIKLFFIHFEEPLRNSKPSAEVISDAHLFDFIFTSDRNIVNVVPNAYWAPLAECWTNGSMKCIDQIDRTAEAKEKEFSVSFNSTSKMGRGGIYQIRKDIWENENKITVPVCFYDSNESPIGDGHPKLPQSTVFQISDKIVLYKSMFNICPENIGEDEENFSQRLIDCFINRTIPIYRGYKNIGNHFNTDGMILVKDGEDTISKINQLTPEYYNERLSAIEDNYNKCIENEYHLSPGQRISNKIKKLYGI
tara:strand:- start:785 stop:1657 length:873 start_codon:yes stop_codon:yes gene_type:complete